MPTHINFRYAEIESLWPSVERYQALAESYGVRDIFQDAGGKMLQLAIATGLDLCEDRNGPDATDRFGNEYEIKTTDISKKTSGFSTNHHLSANTIRRFRARRWIFAIYDGITMQEVYLVEASDLENYFKKWSMQLKKQDSINNPKISIERIREIGTVVYLKDVAPDWAIQPSQGSLAA